MVAELRKVCAYPTLLSEFSMAADASGKEGAAAGEDDSPPESPPADAASPAAAAADEDKQPVDLVAASGKLRMLQQLLPGLQAGGHRVLVLTQSRKVMHAPFGVLRVPQHIIIVARSLESLSFWQKLQAVD